MGHQRQDYGDIGAIGYMREIRDRGGASQQAVAGEKTAPTRMARHVAYKHIQVVKTIWRE